MDRSVKTTVGWMLLTDEGDRFLEAGPALDTGDPLQHSIEQLDLVYQTARAKADRMETLYQQLPSSTTRPAVAAALADLHEDPDTSYKQYEASKPAARR